MTRRIARFFSLPRPERAVLLQALFWLPVTVLALKVRPVGPQAMSQARAPAREPGGGVPSERIAELLRIATRHGLARSNCLSQSLTLCRLLRRQGHIAQLRIGARRSAAGLEAHAWVEHDGRPLNDTLDVSERYTPFPALPAALPPLA